LIYSGSEEKRKMEGGWKKFLGGGLENEKWNLF
jgi:hypothetical protein